MVYIVIMLQEVFLSGVSISVPSLAVFTVVAVLIGIVVEILCGSAVIIREQNGWNMKRRLLLLCESCSQGACDNSERNIKKINGEQPRDTKKSQEKVVNYTEPLFQGEEKPEKAGIPGTGTTYPWRENRNSIMWISKRNWRNP